ncbi:hypothetical protein A9Q99_10460 [Gammaproteobacteria bacterium 45_16_T64]|nr:hypothetical protein A9Q99_10460 [Gammaproteobacteria bacterium 45_16_T64]
MLNIESVNHIGIRIGEKDRSVAFYTLLGFELMRDAGYENGHPLILKHPSGVVLNLLGPATVEDHDNILMDIADKHTGVTHFALTVSSLEDAKVYMETHGVTITGSFSIDNMSAIFIRDPDRNVIELDAYGPIEKVDMGDYSNHV